jgi:hypothetical protein
MSIETLVGRTISPSHVLQDGVFTHPRSYGVYELPKSSLGTCRFRYGNHPVRMRELEREYGSCKLLYLFLQRIDAVAMVTILKSSESVTG